MIEFTYIFFTVLTGYFAVVKFNDLDFYTTMGKDGEFIISLLIGIISFSITIVLLCKFIKLTIGLE